MKVLIYGSRGWIASYVIPELVKQVHEIVEGLRADDPAQVKADLDTHKPTHVLSLIGRTHGATCPTIDYLEEPPILISSTLAGSDFLLCELFSF